MSAELMTKAAYARHRGVGKSAVSNYIKRGQIVLVGTKVDVAKSDAKLDAEVDPASGRDPTPANAAKKASRARPSAPDKHRDPAPEASGSVANEAVNELAQERLEEIRERRHGHALKNAAIAGDLVPFAAYEAKLQAMIAGFCERMQSELRAQSEALANEGAKRKVRGLLDETIQRVRSDFADRLSAGATDPDSEEGDEEDDT